MFHIFEFLTQFVVTQDRSTSCDDFVDRLNRKYTVILLLVFVTVLSSKQYIGEPLACFCPAHFTGAHVEYTNNICWISKAFYVPIETTFSWPSTSTSTVPYIVEELQFQYPNTSHLKFARVENLIAYYPFLLLAQAILFYFPYFFWKNIINRSAYDIGTLIYIAHDSQYSETQAQREKTLRYLIRHIDRANEYYSAKDKVKFKSSSALSFSIPSSSSNNRSNYTTFSSQPTTSWSNSSPHNHPANMEKSQPIENHDTFEVIQMMPSKENDINNNTILNETLNNNANSNNTCNHKANGGSFVKIFENLNFNKLQKKVSFRFFDKEKDKKMTQMTISIAKSITRVRSQRIAVIRRITSDRAFTIRKKSLNRIISFIQKCCLVSTL